MLSFKVIRSNAATLIAVSSVVLMSGCSTAGRNAAEKVVSEVGGRAVEEVAKPGSDVAVKKTAAAISELMKKSAEDKGRIYVRNQLDNGYPVVKKSLEDEIFAALIEEVDLTIQQEARREVRATAVSIAAGILSSSEVEDDSSANDLQAINPEPKSTGWELMGHASTGESVYVDNSSISKSGDAINFAYLIGDEAVSGEAYCSANKWYASGYGEYSPQSQATQNMLNHVCSF